MSAAQRLADWWKARDDRERRMLATMFAMLLAFAWWYGLMAPLQRLRADARQDYLRALRESQATVNHLDKLRIARGSVPDPQQMAEIVVSTAERTGLAVSRKRKHPRGFAIGIDAAEAPAVLAWLDMLRNRHSLVPDKLTIERHGGGVRVEASFGQ